LANCCSSLRLSTIKVLMALSNSFTVFSIFYLSLLIQLYPTFSHLVKSYFMSCCLFLDSWPVQPEVMSMRHIVAGPLNTCGRGPPEKKIKKLELACALYILDFLFGVLAPLVRAPLELFFHNLNYDRGFVINKFIHPLPVSLVF
jgi:hypothetical protein